MPNGTPKSEVTPSRVVASFRLAAETEFGLIRGALRFDSPRFRQRWGLRPSAGADPGTDLPVLSEKERQAMDLLLLMLALALTLTQKETAKLVGTSPSFVSKAIQRAQTRVKEDPDYLRRYNGIRDRVRSSSWHAHMTEGRNLIAQSWALKMRELLDVIARRDDLTPEVRKLVEEAATPPWRTAEVIPDLSGRVPFEGTEEPPVKADPREGRHVIVVSR